MLTLSPLLKCYHLILIKSTCNCFSFSCFFGSPISQVSYSNLILSIVIICKQYLISSPQNFSPKPLIVPKQNWWSSDTKIAAVSLQLSTGLFNIIRITGFLIWKICCGRLSSNFNSQLQGTLDLFNENLVGTFLFSLWRTVKSSIWVRPSLIGLLISFSAPTHNNKCCGPTMINRKVLYHMKEWLGGYIFTILRCTVQTAGKNSSTSFLDINWNCPKRCVNLQ